MLKIHGPVSQTLGESTKNIDIIVFNGKLEIDGVSQDRYWQVSCSGKTLSVNEGDAAHFLLVTY